MINFSRSMMNIKINLKKLLNMKNLNNFLNKISNKLIIKKPKFIVLNLPNSNKLKIIKIFYKKIIKKI